MIITKRIIAYILVASFVITMFACGSSKKKDEAQIYYINSDKSGITPVDYTYKSKKMNDQVEEALDMLKKKPNSVDLMPSIPKSIDIVKSDNDSGILTLFLTGDYEFKPEYTEVLFRAALVKTLVQIKGVKSVSLYLNDAPIGDLTTETIGPMDADTFIDDFGQETESLLSKKLILYFSSADGMSLIPETRTVHYSRNISLENLVVNQVLVGPESDSGERLKTTPQGTEVKQIIVDNGVCIVDFNETFVTGGTGVTEKAMIYSIVNSLTEIEGIKQVMIKVEGDVPHLYNLDVDLSKPLVRNEEIINSQVDKSYLELYRANFSEEDDSDFNYNEE